MFFNAEFSAPWRPRSPCSTLASTLRRRAAPRDLYFVVDGSARARWKAGRTSSCRLATRGAPARDRHHLSGGSAERVGTPRPPQIATRDISPMQAGGGGATTRFVCGYLTWTRSSWPDFESLPPMLKVDVRTDRSGRWLENRSCTWWRRPRECRQRGELVKLSEALIVDTLRRYGRPPRSVDGVARWRTRPGRGKSLALLHRRAHHPWTIAEPPRSRRLPLGTGGAFHALSVGSVDGVPDRMAMRLAAQALTSSSKSVADIAAAVGYESEALSIAPSSAPSARRGGIGVRAGICEPASPTLRT